MPVALTIAGSDSSGGAGIQADLRTFAALEVYGASAVTAVTSQNTLGVRMVHALPPALVADQIDAVLDDLAVAAVKTGMLANADIVDAVVKQLSMCAVPIVVDPVMISSSGVALLDDAGVDLVRARLLPRAALVTPNLAEAERLVGYAVRTVDDQARAAHSLVKLGAHAALVKGGHSMEGDPVDVLFDGVELRGLKGARIDTRHTHGTGCTLASAVAAFLARGVVLADAVANAHAYVRAAIEQAPGLGRGRGPLHQMHPHYRVRR